MMDPLNLRQAKLNHAKDYFDQPSDIKWKGATVPYDASKKAWVDVHGGRIYTREKALKYAKRIHNAMMGVH